MRIRRGVGRIIGSRNADWARGAGEECLAPTVTVVGGAPRMPRSIPPAWEHALLLDALWPAVETPARWPDPPALADELTWQRARQVLGSTF
jgi:hypothetical protein